jgi:hypothetical protein
MTGWAEQDGGIRQRPGHSLHMRDPARRRGDLFGDGGRDLVRPMPGKQQHGKDEAGDAGKGEWESETCHRHERGHDHSDGDDQPEGRSQSCNKLADTARESGNYSLRQAQGPGYCAALGVIVQGGTPIRSQILLVAAS